MPQIQVLFARGMPWQGQQPIQISMYHARFRRHRRHDAQPRQFFHRLLMDFVGQLGGADLVAQLLQFLLENIAIAELLLDQPHLFAQVHLALVGGDLVLQATVHLFVQQGVLQIAAQRLRQPLQPLPDIRRFQQLLHQIRPQGQDRRQRIA